MKIFLLNFLFVFSSFLAFGQEAPPEPDLIDKKDVVGVYYYSTFEPKATKFDLKADDTFDMIYYSRSTSQFAPSEFKREKANGTWICRDDTIIISPTGASPEKYIAFKGKLYKVYAEFDGTKYKDIPVSATRVEEDSYWIPKKVTK